MFFSNWLIRTYVSLSPKLGRLSRRANVTNNLARVRSSCRLWLIVLCWSTDMPAPLCFNVWNKWHKASMAARTTWWKTCRTQLSSTRNASTFTVISDSDLGISCKSSSNTHAPSHCCSRQRSKKTTRFINSWNVFPNAKFPSSFRLVWTYVLPCARWIAWNWLAALNQNLGRIWIGETKLYEVRIHTENDSWQMKDF